MKILKTILLTLLTIWLTSCGDGNNTKETRQKTSEELKSELKQLELSNPRDYLDCQNVTLQLQKKLVKEGGLFRNAEYADDGGLIQGSFVNKATLAKYKDITIKVSYYSQTKTLISESAYIIYEFYNAHSTKNFSLKVDPPKAYKTFSFRVTGATPVWN